MTTGPEPGYYADPATPGFIRYWDGARWVPGTSRPADPARAVSAAVSGVASGVISRDPGRDIGANEITAVFQPISPGVFEDRPVGDTAATQEIRAVREPEVPQPARRAEEPPEDFVPWQQDGAPRPARSSPRESAWDSVPARDLVRESAREPVQVSARDQGFAPQSPPPPSPFAAIPGFGGPERAEPVAEDVRVVELASPGSRVLARIIDLGIAALVSAPATVTLLLVAHRHDHQYVQHLRLIAKTTYRTLGMDATGIALWGAALLILFAVAIGYEGYRVGRTGQTAGRRLCGVRVVAVRNAEPVTSGAASTRALLFWVLALIPLVDLLALGGIFWGRPFAQGLHEKTTRTISIKD